MPRKRIKVLNIDYFRWFFSWWEIISQLGLSLLELSDGLSFFQSTDTLSRALIHLLYALFLVMALILLINMLIALLSNTYQQVQVLKWTWLTSGQTFRVVVLVSTCSHSSSVYLALNFFWTVDSEEIFDRNRNLSHLSLACFRGGKPAGIFLSGMACICWQNNTKNSLKVSFPQNQAKMVKWPKLICILDQSNFQSSWLLQAPLTVFSRSFARRLIQDRNGHSAKLLQSRHIATIILYQCH